MGAIDFYETGEGTSAKKAFIVAHGYATDQYGSGGYTGSLAEKEYFVEIPVPQDWTGKEYEYAQHLILNNDSRVDDKWGPAGCIYISSRNTTKDVISGATITKNKQTGTRKWVTAYVLYSNSIAISKHSTQNEAEIAAKALIDERHPEVLIKIEKQLTNGDPIIMKLSVKTKKEVIKDGMHKYLFFGVASS